MVQFSLNAIFEGLMRAGGTVWSYLWWLLLPVAAFFVYKDVKTAHDKAKKLRSVEWRLLEVKVSRALAKLPKSMEHIFSGLYAVEKAWFSCEIVGGAGESHFYFRIPKQYRNLLESAVYAQYSDAEITEVSETEDYLKNIPERLPNKTYDVYGGELTLKKPSPYPIRTYVEFEDREEETRVDPIAPLMEAIARLEKDERLWLQIVCTPADDKWQKEGEKIIDELLGKKKEEKKKSPLFGFTLQEVVLAPYEHPSLESEKKEEKKEKPDVTPAKRAAVEAIDKKIAKIGFNTTIRFLYIDSRENFSRDNVVAVLGSFRQFNTQNFNQFESNKKVVTSVSDGLFQKLRTEWRKRSLYERYRLIAPRENAPVMNTEELATIYHFPPTGVLAPSLPRVEAKRGGPPTNLPIAE